MSKKPARERAPLDDLPIPFVTRKTPVLLTIRIIAAFFGLELIYILLRLLPETEGSINLGSFWVFLIVFGLQVLLVSYLTLRWAVETYEIHKKDIHYKRGILFRHEETYPYNNMQSITCDQSPLGRIYHYGSVKLFIPTLGRDLVFDQVPHPHHFIQTIRHVLPYPDQQRFIIHG